MNELISVILLLMLLLSGCDQLSTSKDSPLPKTQPSVEPVSDYTIEPLEIPTPQPTPTDKEIHLETQNTNYSISISDSSLFTSNDEWPSVFSRNTIWFPQIHDLVDYDLNKRINETIVMASLGWLSEDNMLEWEAQYPVLHCFSERYFSFEISAETEKNYNGRRNYFYCYVTVDLLSGERVKLDDLLYISDELISALKRGSIVKRADSWILWYDTEEEAVAKLKDTLNEKSNEELYEMFENEAFYVKNGQIIFDVKPTGGIILLLDDIEEFLKVPKW